MTNNPFENSHKSEEIPLDLGEYRPPLSVVALLAGIIGLVVLIPWLPAVGMASKGSGSIRMGMLVGILGGVFALILGVISFFQTRHEVRRGRWLGVTGGIFGLLGIGTNLLVGFGLFITKASLGCGQDAIAVLKTSAADRAAETDKWISRFASKRMSVSIKPNEFEDWLEQIAKKHGQLQQHELPKTNSLTTKNGAIVVHIKGHFVNGITPIEVEIGIDGDQAKVDDIRVGDSSPLD